MFVAVICRDKPDSVELRMKLRPDHLAFLETLGTRLRMAGALLDDAAEKPIGSLIVLEAPSLQEARSLLADDPYRIGGLFADVEFRPWNWFIGNPDVT